MSVFSYVASVIPLQLASVERSNQKRKAEQLVLAGQVSTNAAMASMAASMVTPTKSPDVDMSDIPWGEEITDEEIKIARKRTKMYSTRKTTPNRKSALLAAALQPLTKVLEQQILANAAHQQQMAALAAADLAFRRQSSARAAKTDTLLSLLAAGVSFGDAQKYVAAQAVESAADATTTDVN